MKTILEEIFLKAADKAIKRLNTLYVYLNFIVYCLNFRHETLKDESFFIFIFTFLTFELFFKKFLIISMILV